MSSVDDWTSWSSRPELKGDPYWTHVANDYEVKSAGEHTQSIVKVLSKH